MYNFIDLFAGCGGLSEGFYRQGYNSLVHVELDKYACQTLKKRMEFYNYNDIERHIIEEDINNEFIISLIKERVGSQPIDIIIGGPPCQSFSTLGRARDEYSMKKDKRNFLFESYVKILNFFKPKFFVFENVTGILSSKVNGKKMIDIIVMELSKNYNLIENPEKMILNSVHYGVPQERNRVIILGVRKDLNINPEKIYNGIEKTNYSLSDEKNKENMNLKKYVTVKDAIIDLPKIKPGEGKISTFYKPITSSDYILKMREGADCNLYDHVARNHNDLDQLRYYEMAKNNWTFKELLENRKDLHHANPRVFGNSYVVQKWDEPAKTVIAHLYKDGNQFIHPDYEQSRTLTPREAARLQSFPDNFEFPVSITQQYKQIGNAVPPLLAEAIAKAIKIELEAVDNREKK